MKNIKLFAASTLLLGSMVLAIPGFAGDKDERGGWKHHAGWDDGHGSKRLAHLLDLTDTQKETLKAQREAQQGARDALRDKIGDARDALAIAVDAGANDAELAVLTETLGKLHAEQLLAGAKAHKAFIAVLTDEQKQKLTELKRKREARRSVRENEPQGSSGSNGA